MHKYVSQLPQNLKQEDANTWVGIITKCEPRLLCLLP